MPKERVERDEEQPNEEPVPVATEEPEKAEVGILSALGLDVDLRVGGRGSERVDLREQFRRRCERRSPRASARGHPARSATAGRADRGGGAGGARALGDLRAAHLFVVEAVPRGRCDALDLRVVDVGRENPGAAFDEQPDLGRALTAGAARDDRDQAVEVGHQFPFRCRC